MPSNRSLHISSKENKVKRRSKITKNKPSILQYKRFIRQMCAAGYLSKDLDCIPKPSGNDGEQRCGICNKTEKDLLDMMQNKFGKDWKKEIKKICNSNKPVLANFGDIEASKNAKVINVENYFGDKAKEMISKIIKDNDQKVSHQINIFKTLPPQFELRMTEDNHFSVVTKEPIGSSTRFGPFEGTSDEITNSDSYWEYTDSNGNSRTINGQSCIKSNWVSRIRKNEYAANCVAWLENNKIYYKSIKDIPKQSELIVHPKLYQGQVIVTDLAESESEASESELEESVLEEQGSEESESEESELEYRDVNNAKLREKTIEDELNIDIDKIGYKPKADWFEQHKNKFSPELKMLLKITELLDGYNFYEPEIEKLTEEDLIGLKEGRLSENFVKFYVEIVLEETDGMLQLPTSQDKLEELVVPEELKRNFICGGCIRTKKGEWCTVFSVKKYEEKENKDLIYYFFAKVDPNEEYKKSRAELIKALMKLFNKHVREYELKKFEYNNSHYYYNVIEPQLKENSEIYALEMLKNMVDSHYCTPSRNSVSTKFGLLKWYYADRIAKWIYYKETEETKQDKKPTSGFYKAMDKTLKLVKPSEISPKHKSVFIDVESRIDRGDLQNILSSSWESVLGKFEWETHFREHLSPDVRRFFCQSGWEENFTPTVKLMDSGQVLLAYDLASLRGDEWLTEKLLEFYTYRQIEKFGLQQTVRYCTINSASLVQNISKSGMDVKSKFAEDAINSPEKKLPEADYCICVYNVNDHYASLFASKKRKKIYISDSRSVEWINEDKIFKEIKEAFSIVWNVDMEIEKVVERDLQVDNNNCGVFAAEFNEQILRAIRLSLDASREFEWPGLRVDIKLMARGVYRWKMAEYILHENIGLPLSNYSSLHTTHSYIVYFKKDDLKKLMFEGQEEKVVCSTCKRAYRPDDRTEFRKGFKLKDIENEDTRKKLEYVNNLLGEEEYCFFCRSTENLTVQRHSGGFTVPKSRQVEKLPNNPIDKEFPKRLTPKKKESIKKSNDNLIKKTQKTTDDKTQGSGQKRKESLPQDGRNSKKNRVNTNSNVTGIKLETPNKNKPTNPKKSKDKNRQQSPSTANKQQSVSRNLFGQ